MYLDYLVPLDNLSISYFTKTIPFASDLDIYKTTGFYFYASHGHSINNTPCGNRNFTLQVYDGYYVHQFLQSENKFYMRYYNADLKIWTSWKQVI